MGFSDLSKAEIIYIYDLLKKKTEEMEALNAPTLTSQDLKIIKGILRKLDREYPGLAQIPF